MLAAQIIEFQSVGVKLFDSFTIYYYGILIVAAILLSATIAGWMAKRAGKDPDHVWNGLTWALIPAIIGARLWFVFFPPESVAAVHDTGWMLTHPFDFEHGPLAIRSGGLGIAGALLGGALGIYLYYRRNRQTGSLLEWLDLVIVVIPLGQAIGRWGNYINKELYGKPTGVDWWGIEIPLEYRTEAYAARRGYGADTLFHPLFLYESMWNFLLFVVLLFVWNRYRHRLHRGDILLMYLVGYPLGRFWMEFLRAETAYVAGLNVNQIIAGLICLASLALLVYRHRLGAPPGAEPAISAARVDAAEATGDEASEDDGD
jgi:phosphatidylglycerol:prolipoprotein diacylglycerol transferase